MKRILALMSAAAVLFAAQAAGAERPPKLPAEAEESFSAALELPVDDIKKGETVYINIGITPKAEIYAFEAALTYDSALLEYKKKSEDNDRFIKIDNSDDNEILLAVSRLGEQDINASDKLCTLEFTAKDYGSSNIRLKSVKAVFSDMTYFDDENVGEVLNVSVEKPKTENRRPSGGGGGGGGKVSISGTRVTASAATVPAEPQLFEAAEPSAQSREPDFADVPVDFWAYEAIHSLFERGTVSGSGETPGLYMPENCVTRAEFAKLIAGEFGISAQEKTNIRFSDVASDYWGFDVINTAAAAGIVKGDERGAFMPEAQIKREDAAVMLVRCIDYLGAELTGTRTMTELCDAEDIADYAKYSVERLYAAGILNGSDDGNFYPQQNMTRAEAAALVYRLSVTIGGEQS